MKHKNEHMTQDERDMYDDETGESKSNKKIQEHRRPIRNWKKVWSEHESDYDEYDEFFQTKSLK